MRTRRPRRLKSTRRGGGSFGRRGGGSFARRGGGNPFGRRGSFSI